MPDGIRIQKDGAGRPIPQHYKVVVELPPDPSTGERRRKAKHVHGPLAKAKSVRQAMLVQLKAGQLVGKDDQRLKAFLESWVAAKRGTVSERTYQRYDSLMKSIIRDLGSTRLRDLSPQGLRDYFAGCSTEPSRRRPGESISPTTVHHRYVTLKSALQQATDDGILGRNPLEWKKDARPKRLRPIPAVIGEDVAVELVRASVDSPIEVLVWMAYHTGARLGELLSLRWSDIDMEARTVTITRTVVEPLVKKTAGKDWFTFKEPKNKCGRSIVVGDGTITMLKKHRTDQNAHRLALPPDAGWRDENLVFPNLWNLKGVQPGEPMRPTTASRIFRKIVADAGHKGVRFHDLRHAHASVLIGRGESLKVVSQRLGHSDEAITLKVYTHVLPGQEGAMVDRFEASFERAMDGENDASTIQGTKRAPNADSGVAQAVGE